MKLLIKYPLQKWANFVINKMSVAKTETEFDLWMKQGLFIESFCQTLRIELD